MLHLNELHFRAIFKHIDDETCGPQAFRGDIDSQLNFDPCSLPLVQFNSIPGERTMIEDEIMNDLSLDQIYLHRICQTIHLCYSNAKSSDLIYFESASPGNLNHAR